MNSKEVVIDTNFFMVPFQFNVDVIMYGKEENDNA